MRMNRNIFYHTWQDEYCFMKLIFVYICMHMHNFYIVYVTYVICVYNSVFNVCLVGGVKVTDVVEEIDINQIITLMNICMQIEKTILLEGNIVL